jgi:hypothetical protein
VGPLRDDEIIRASPPTNRMKILIKEVSNSIRLTCLSTFCHERTQHSPLLEHIVIWQLLGSKEQLPPDK